MFATAESELDEDEDTIKLVMVCKAGRNRSVSAKVVLNYVFGWLGYDSNDEDGFLSKPFWHRGKRKSCYTCDRCAEMTDMKERSCQHACRVWASLYVSIVADTMHCRHYKLV